MANTNRQQIGRYAGLVSWANTTDRSARTAPARRNAPNSIEYHKARLPEKFNDATEKQRDQAAEAAKRAYFARLAMLSAQARRKPAAADKSGCAAHYASMAAESKVADDAPS